MRDKQGFELRPEQVLHGAGEEDDQTLDHDHHVAGDLRLLEGEFRAALIERAEQERGKADADRMERPIRATAMPTKP